MPAPPALYSSFHTLSRPHSLPISACLSTSPNPAQLSSVSWAVPRCLQRVRVLVGPCKRAVNERRARSSVRCVSFSPMRGGVEPGGTAVDDAYHRKHHRHLDQHAHHRGDRQSTRLNSSH